MSSSLQMVIEAYLSSSSPQQSSEWQVLVGTGKACVMPLINATIARIDSDYRTSYDQMIKKYIDCDFAIVAAIGHNAFEVLYRAIQDTNDNIVLVSALILLEENKPSSETLHAVSIARGPLSKKKERTGKFDRNIDSTLWWIYCFILFHSRSDPIYDQHFLETLSKIDYSNPIDGLKGIKEESYRVLLKSLLQ